MVHLLVLSLLALTGHGGAAQYTESAIRDKIDSARLPGAEGLSITFNQFSGYLDGIKYRELLL